MRFTEKELYKMLENGKMLIVPFGRDEKHIYHVIGRKCKKGGKVWYWKKITYPSMVTSIAIHGNDGRFFNNIIDAKNKVDELQKKYSES